MSREAYANNLDMNLANSTVLTPLSLIRRSAAVYPDKPALVHGDVTQSWSETYANCVRLASALQGRGIGELDTVAIMCPNTPPMYEAHFGVPMIGAVLNALNYRLTAPEIEYLARVSEIFGFTEEDFHRWLALHGDEGPRPWDVLGVDPAIPDDELRVRWKALVRDHHPDKLVADGMPEEFVAAANDRLARINAAYDSMMRSRGFGGAPAGGAG